MSVPSIPTVTLNDRTTIPAVGFGAGTALFGGECTKYTLSALEKGYRYLDMAQMYGNSQWVGEAIQQWGGKREELYLVTKLGKDKATSDEIHPRTVLEAELKKLGVDHVDLFLIHNPFYIGDRTLSETWKILEDLKKEGLTKSIGVSNFREEDILELAATWEVPPAVNQIEYHPYVYHAANMQRLAAVCQKHDIKIQAYGPQTPLFRSPGGPLDPVVEKIAKAHGATAGQVLLAWAHQQPGGIVVTTSRDDGRQKEQLEALVKVDLTGGQVDEISEAGKGRFYRHFMKVVWDVAKP